MNAPANAVTFPDIPKLSICIPYYKGHASIEFLLASILRQIPPLPTTGLGSVEPALPREQVEIVIANDSLDDASVAFLDRLAECYSVSVVHNERTLGLSGNWSRALGLGRGEIVTLMHQDDWYSPNCFSLVLNRFAESPDLVLYVPGQAIFGGAHRSARIVPHRIEGRYSGAAYAALLRKLDGVAAPSQTFFRRSCLEGLNALYPEDYEYCPELDLCYRLSQRCADGTFEHDARVSICRGLHVEQFSRLHQGKRVRDFATFLLTHLGDGRSRPDTVANVELAQEAICSRFSELVERINILDVDDIGQRRSQLCSLLKSDNFWHALARGYSGSGRLWRTLSEKTERRLHVPMVEILASGGARAAAAGFPLANVIVNLRRRGYGISDEALPEVERRAERIARSEQFNQPVFICGFHHSGTRLVAELLSAVGVFQVVNSTTYEWTYIQALNTFILPQWASASELREFESSRVPLRPDRDELAFRLSMNGYTAETPWGHKDPRTCGTIDAWIDCFPRARVVHILRDPRDVIGTLPGAYSRFAPSGLPPQQDVSHWTELWATNVDIVRRSRERAAAYVEVTFEDLCLSPRTVLAAIVDGLGLRLDVDAAVEQFSIIKPDKIGVHRHFLADGRLDSVQLEKIVAAAGNQFSPVGRSLGAGAAQGAISQ